MATAIVASPRGSSSRDSATISGISRTQITQLVAQNSTITTWPRRSARSMRRPSIDWKVTSGAGRGTMNRCQAVQATRSAPIRQTVSTAARRRRPAGRDDDAGWSSWLLRSFTALVYRDRVGRLVEGFLGELPAPASPDPQRRAVDRGGPGREEGVVAR